MAGVPNCLHYTRAVRATKPDWPAQLSSRLRIAGRRIARGFVFPTFFGFLRARFIYILTQRTELGVQKRGGDK